MSEDNGIHDQIKALVTQEHALREQVQSGSIDRASEQAQLKEVEEALDQCWDLLRQRDARRAAGRDPGGATARPIEQVENYEN